MGVSALVPILLTITIALSDKPTVPGRFTVDLDLPAAQRWNDIVPRYKEAVKDIHDLLLEMYDDLAILDFVASELDRYFSQPYADEMRGISLALNMSLGEVVMANLLYELNMVCTSIVLEDNKNSIWHTRNFDFGIDSSKLRDITILVDFQRNKKTVYTAATFAGYVGILSGQKPNAYSITVNGKNDQEFFITLVTALLDRKAKPVGFLVRDTFESSDSYNQTITTLANTDTFSDAYIAVAGLQDEEAVVITKQRIETSDFWYINASHGHWFDVQTNFDHGLIPPYRDLNKTRLATEALNKVGRSGITMDSLFDVMSIQDVLSNGTVYTVLMNPSQPEMIKLFVRNSEK